MKINIKNKKELDNLYEWERRFNKADRIKKLAFKLHHKINHKILDKRVSFAWSKVTDIEPTKTFIDGNLTSKASFLLNMVKIEKALNKTQLFVIK